MYFQIKKHDDFNCVKNNLQFLFLSFFHLAKEKNCEHHSPIVGEQIISNVLFHESLSFIDSCLTSKLVFHYKKSSFKGSLPSKVVFHQTPTPIKGCLPSKIVFQQSLSYLYKVPKLPKLTHLTLSRGVLS